MSDRSSQDIGGGQADRLFSNVFAAAREVWPHYVRSIFGESQTWDTDTCPHSEVGQLRRGGFRKALDELVQVALPALPLRPSGLGIPGIGLLFRPCAVLQQPRPDGTDPYQHESWMFINGICTDRDVAHINARYLVQLFGAPVTILYDSTCGLIPDLIECAAGKGWGSLTAAGRLALPPLVAALLNPEKSRVVLLCHSRGTIIAAAVLHALASAVANAAGPASHTAEAQAGWQLYREWRDRSPAMQRARRRRDVADAVQRHGGGDQAPRPQDLAAEHLRKLEIYAIANCASDMCHVAPAEGNRPPVPYIESLGNEHDLVARLGVLAERKGEGGVRIDGNCYRRSGAWGHLLNAHYLCELEQDVIEGRRGLEAMDGTVGPSRLQAMIRDRGPHRAE
jgi:hypothetical protein